MKLKKPGYPWTIFPIEILTNKYGGRLLRFLKYRLACLHGDVGQWADVEKVVVEPMVLCVRQTNVGKFHLLLFFLSGRIGQGRVKSAIFIHNSTIHGFETKRAETLDKKNRMNGTSAEVFQSLTFQIYRHSKTLTYHRQRAPNRLLMNMNTYWLFIEYR